MKDNFFSTFSILIVFLLFSIVGIITTPFLSVQMFPNRTYNSLIIITNLENSSIEVTESSITTPIESSISTLKGIVNVSSSTGQGVSIIRIELDKYTEPELFRFEAALMIRQIYPKLPDGASFPNVYLNRPSNGNDTQAILGYSVQGPASKQEITGMIEKHIRPAMADIKGIYQFDVSGDPPAEVAIYTNSKRMQAAHISVTDLERQLREVLKNHNIGTISFVDGMFAVSLSNGITSEDALQKTIVAKHSGRMFRLEDVAVVTTGQTLVNSHYRINGQDLVSLTFWADENVNTIRLASEIKERVAQIKELLPTEYVFELQLDTTNHIKEELEKILLRTAISVGILLLFVLLITWNLRYMVIVILSILANVSISFIGYYIFKIDVHLYSLAGITIAIGLITDNVIVIVEDIRHTGRNRIFKAILASTVTALGALSVIFFLEENLKLNLIDFALAIILNLLISLPIAYYFIPALLSLMPVRMKKTKSIFKRKKILVAFSTMYKRQLCFMLRFRLIFLMIFILSFGIPLFLLPEKIETKNESFWSHWYNATLGSNFYNSQLREPLNKYLGGVLNYYVANNTSVINFNAIDNESQMQLYVDIDLPIGATISHMDEICRNFEKVIALYQNSCETFTTSIISGSEGRIQILFKKKSPTSSAYKLKNELERLAGLAGAANSTVYGIGRGFNNSLNMDRFDSAILIKGYNYQQLQSIASIVRDSLLSNHRISDVLISSRKVSRRSSTFEHVVHINKPEYLTFQRVPRWNLSRTLMQETENMNHIGKLLSLNGTPVNVTAYHQHNQIPDVWSIMHEPLQVNDSTVIRMGGLSQREKVRVGSQIMRENQEYFLHINYQFVGDYELNKLIAGRVVKAIAPILPYGYTIEDTLQNTGTKVGDKNFWLIPIVLVIIYMICAILLESLKQPIAVILMIPFSFIGVFLTFRYLGLQFDQGGYAALLMLSGVVTNAALYIINDYNQLNKKKYKFTIERFVKAYNAKAMPILVTTLAALLSLLPFMLTGEEKGFWFTLSAGTIAGLLFSLLGVYLFLPICLLGNEKRKVTKNSIV